MRIISALAVCAVALGAHALDRGTVEQRKAECRAAGESGKHRCFASSHPDGKVNLFYGWNVGKGHPIDDNDPPDHKFLLNGLDQCGWYHDRGAGRWNPHTKVCEGTFMCANSVFLYNCMKSYPPANAEEAAEKKKAMERVAALKACVPKFYKTYGVGWTRDAHGSYWMSQKAEEELLESFAHCKPGMKTPGYPPDWIQQRLAQFKAKYPQLAKFLGQ